MSVQTDYEAARRHGLGHDAALEAISSGEPLRCWCGSDKPCDGGARRLVGCPVFRATRRKVQE